jgi:glycosyltransferase involved in cell wall biosynthesis
MFNSHPLISIIIPTYNRGFLITRAVLSVLQQTYNNLEVIVIDDASTDDTSKRVAELQNKDSRVLYFRLKSNMGAQAARNIGIKKASGEFIGFLDSDNEWLPQKLELQMKFFECGRRKCGVVYSGFRRVFDDNSPSKDEKPCFRGNIYKDSLREWIADTSTLVVEKDLLLRVGQCDERVRAYQEWDLCIRLARYAEFDFVDEPLVIYNIINRIPTISKDLLNTANGYLDIVSIHRDEILKELGHDTLSKHLLYAAHLFIEGGAFDAALVPLAQLIRHDPFCCKALAYWCLCRFRPGMISKIVSFKKSCGF